MRESTFFETTRGRILESIKRRGNRTVAELASEQGLTANAVRQHLVRLEAQGLIAEHRERRSRTKPSSVFSVTHAGDRLFPQRYDVLLNAMLHELKAEEGPERVTDLFRKIGQRSARKYADRFEGKDAAGRVGEITKILREQGVVADWETAGEGFVIREHSCPFKDTVATHPQVCTVVHTLMSEVLPGNQRQATSIAKGDDVCEFHITPAATSGEPNGLS